MFGLNDPDHQKAAIFGLLIVGGAALYYQYLWSPLHAERVVVEERLERLQRANEAARAVTQPRRVKELRQREAEYQVALTAYETMLPSQAEVPGLLEEISAAALAEQVAIVSFAPLDEIRGAELVEFPYDLQIQGDYHAVGRFLAEVVNLPRLVRPSVLALEGIEIAPATETLDAEYEILATLLLSTFVPAGLILAETEIEGTAAASAGGSTDAS